MTSKLRSFPLALGVALALALIVAVTLALTFVIPFMFPHDAALPQSANYPDRPIRMIIPSQSGSDVDESGRFFARQLAAVFGRPVVVENKPGADGVVGVMAVKNAPADGYTLLLASNSLLTVSPLVIKNLRYEPTKDLRPISGLTREMTVFVVPVGSRLETLADLVAAMKKAPLPMTVGTYSTSYRLAIEWFAALAGVKLTNVPYKGAPTMFSDLLGSHLDWAVADLIVATELLRSGRLRAIAVSGEARHEDFPDIPTIKESGYPGYVDYTWSSLSVRAETPDAITVRLADALQQVLAQAATKEFVRRAKVDLMPFTAAVQQRFQQAEIDRLKKVAEAAGIRPE